MSQRSATGKYYLVCDPATGEVVLRTHEWALRLSHYEQIPVSRLVWKRYRVGKKIRETDIPEPYRERWLKARVIALRLNEVGY